MKCHLPHTDFKNNFLHKSPVLARACISPRQFDMYANRFFLVVPWQKFGWGFHIHLLLISTQKVGNRLWLFIGKVIQCPLCNVVGKFDIHDSLWDINQFYKMIYFSQKTNAHPVFIDGSVNVNWCWISHWSY